MSKQESRRIEKNPVREQEVVAHIDATSSLGMKLRIEEVGEDREVVHVSCGRYLRFGEVKKVKLSSEEVVLKN